MKFVPTLYAERLEGHIRYRLEVPERDAGLALQEEFNHGLDQATILALRQSADALLRSKESPTFASEAERRGSVLYRTLLPQRLREQLKRLSGPLLVSTSLYGIPWELLFDDEEFWGTRYAIGKRLMMSRALTTEGCHVQRLRPRALVVGSDPRGDLPFVHEEVERICDTLRGVTEVCCVSGPMATFDAVTSYLREGFDLIHYCGHVLADRTGGPALLLADETPLAAEVIEPNLAGQPLVFLNGCASARNVDGETAKSWEECLSSVAYGFLFGGALGVVGTYCDVSDRHAATLAEFFYRRALDSCAVGEALRLAREHCRAAPASAMSPTWLSFVLYGNPAQELLPSAKRPAPAPTVAAIARHRPGAPAERAAPRLLRWSGIVGLAICLAAVLGYQALQRRPHAIGSPAPLVVGVMEVRTRGTAVPDWMREVTRDGLNTIFSKVSKVHVYSRQKIDFVRENRHLSEIEAAEALGMTKMVAVTLSLADSTASLEAQIVDIESGLLEASERAQGPVGDLIELQNQLAIKTLQALGARPADAELKAILANRTNDTLESYKLLSQTLGGAGDLGAPPLAPSVPPPGHSWLGWQAVAFAQEPSAEERAIYDLIEHYRAALEHKDVTMVAQMQADMTEDQRTALVQYLQNAGDLVVRISNIDILIEGDNALATFTREDAFTDSRSGRRLHLELRISSILGRDGGGWKIRSVRKPS